MIAIVEHDQLERLRTISWKGASQIPVPPQSVMEFSALARKPNVKLSELSAVVDCEPALTAELLRNVNSVVRGLRQKVESVTQAIALLGIPNSTTILLTSALARAVRNQESSLIPSADFRRETVERALFSRETARMVGVDATVSYTAAMLQDILLPLLTRQYRAEYSEYLANAEAESLVDFEQQMFGWTHAELAAKTLLEWGFPESLAWCVLQHHASAEQMLVEPTRTPQAFPGAAAALLMDVLRQSPDGVSRLVDLSRINPRFQLMRAIEAVDEALPGMNGTLQHSLPLMQRLQHAMLEQLEHHRGQAAVPGRQFGNYVLEDKLKESSMGAIFRARHIRIKRPAAIKILRADRTNRETIAQFEREVQLTCSLRHPNTVSIFDYGHTVDDLFFYAMEYIDGLTLADLVQIEGRLGDGRVLFLMRQICGSLAEAHGHQLIHRDIKPENIMVSDRFGHPDHVTVLDFGLVESTRVESAASATHQGIIGTPLFMSPEAALRQAVIDHRSDLYSLGAVGYYLLTGRPPFIGNSLPEMLRHHVETMPVPPSARCDVPVSTELEQLLMQCLSKEPSQRPANAVELAERLTACVPIEPWTDQLAARWWTNFSQLGLARGDHPTLSEDDSFSKTLVATDSAASASSVAGI